MSDELLDALRARAWSIGMTHIIAARLAAELAR